MREPPSAERGANSSVGTNVLGGHHGGNSDEATPVMPAQPQWKQHPCVLWKER